MLLAIALASGVAALAYAYLRLRTISLERMSQAAFLARNAGDTVAVLARLLSLTADLLRALAGARPAVEAFDELEN
jgi:hypothetical protein